MWKLGDQSLLALLQTGLNKAGSKRRGRRVDVDYSRVVNNDVVMPFRITDTKLMPAVLIDERAVDPQCVDETVQAGKAVESFPRIIAVIIVAHLEQEF